MAFYNLISFGILVAELLTFFVVIFPLPFAWRRAMFKAIAESHIIARLQYGLKITFIFIAVLFADAVNQMLKIHREREAVSAAGPAGVAAAPDMRAQADYRSRKFLSERNFYLHGSCLVLCLILSRTYSLVRDLIRAQEDLAILQAQTGTGGPEAERLADPSKRLGDTDKKKVKPQVVDKKQD
ncbi:B-cell receptor-associated protein 31-like-domain-containing protein [Rhodotorula diobovata]|uniref:Endoplasmic reticulum transmembrane protein n=1 Tax=Rhodotorula diobovata TaxID=5288 RepID=A0A5C5G4U6_9BASI|nr:B-cell receptor-associated protein 31-like-domain-containing protein [Rhodotorula diobovata]